MTATELIPLVVLGAVCGLDVVSFPQAMISRPIVAATVAGALSGHPGDGLLIGAILELVAMETLPFGASRYPEWGSASVVGGALFAAYGTRAGALPLAVFATLLAAMVSGHSMVVLRRLNGRRTARARDAVDHGSVHAVSRLQIGGLGLDLLRGALLTLVLLLLLRPLLAGGVEVWAAPAVLSTAVVVGIAAAVAGGIIWNALPAGGRRTRGALLALGVLIAVIAG